MFGILKQMWCSPKTRLTFLLLLYPQQRQELCNQILDAYKENLHCSWGLGIWREFNIRSFLQCDIRRKNIMAIVYIYKRLTKTLFS